MRNLFLRSKDFNITFQKYFSSTSQIIQKRTIEMRNSIETWQKRLIFQLNIYKNVENISNWASFNIPFVVGQCFHFQSWWACCILKNFAEEIFAIDQFWNFFAEEIFAIDQFCNFLRKKCLQMRVKIAKINSAKNLLPLR